MGIVGGRPSSSLYFLGYQADNLLYLDPHDPQATGALPTVAPTYFCHTPRAMPIASIDPSLAIGFYCGSLGELAAWCALRLCQPFCGDCMSNTNLALLPAIACSTRLATTASHHPTRQGWQGMHIGTPALFCPASAPAAS